MFFTQDLKKVLFPSILDVSNSLGREFFKAAPVPVHFPVPFVRVPPGPVHYAVPFGTFECRSL